MHVTATPSYVRFDGTSTAQVSITADGSWTAQTDQGWLSLSNTSGSGNATITLTVNRVGLPAGNYAASVLFKGADPLEVVTVSMRFPNLSGTVSDSSGQILPQVLAPASSPPIGSLTPGRDYVPGEVLIGLDPTMTVAINGGSGLVPAAATLTAAEIQTAAQTLTKDHGLTIERALGDGVPVVVARTTRSVPDTIQDLQADARVRVAEPNYLNQPLWTPTDPDYSLQWDMPQINMPAAWDITRGSGDITAAVIDNGFITSHVDLAANMLGGYDFGDDDSDPSPTASGYCGEHGTHVAGTVAAVADNGLGVTGVAPGVHLLPLKIGQSTTNCPLPDSALLAALYYAAGYTMTGAGALPKPVDVVNLSLGGPSYSLLVDEAVTAAVGQGVTVVAATGNENGAILYPAALTGTIAVGAVDRYNVKAPYSNYGQEIDVVAPGGDETNHIEDGILSTGPTSTSYQYMQGTSMASPHVAGVVALMRSVNRGLNPDEARYILRNTATDLGLSGADTYYGYGLVNAAAAVQTAQSWLTGNATDLIVRLTQGATVAAEVRADSAGHYGLNGIPSGSYTLEAGTDVDHDGVLGEGGEFYASTPITISYTGDQVQSLTVTPR
ncbi:MAG: S8 family serine peptidase [Deinococcales bacterium]